MYPILTKKKAIIISFTIITAFVKLIKIFLDFSFPTRQKYGSGIISSACTKMNSYLHAERFSLMCSMSVPKSQVFIESESMIGRCLSAEWLFYASW